eukprot:15661335-Heterocapsa_arctica.AAC.2
MPHRGRLKSYVPVQIRYWGSASPASQSPKLPPNLANQGTSGMLPEQDTRRSRTSAADLLHGSTCASAPVPLSWNTAGAVTRPSR